jgi:hypothetical protein
LKPGSGGKLFGPHTHMPPPCGMTNSHGFSVAMGWLRVCACPSSKSTTSQGMQGEHLTHMPNGCKAVQGMPLVLIVHGSQPTISGLPTPHVHTSGSFHENWRTAFCASATPHHTTPHHSAAASTRIQQPRAQVSSCSCDNSRV